MANRREFLLGAVAGTSLTVTSARAAPTDARELRAYIIREMQKAGIPGLQVAVVQKGKIVFQENFGLADVENSYR